MTVEQMRERKKKLGYSNEQIAELSGLSLKMVEEILEGIAESPSYDVFSALQSVLTNENSSKVCEASAVYNTKRQGEYTLEDYLALPEERRVELIDGVFYDMAAPLAGHQAIGGEIFRKIRNFVDSNKCKCIPLNAPVDVQLDCDDRTVVQPDVLVICNRDKFKNGRVFGAPDFVVEVLSPSTSKRDCTLKLAKYSEAGVRECWIVDPKNKRVLVYNFEVDECLTLYTFEDVVPVQIYEGRCEIDFREIYEYVKFLYEEEE